MNAIKRFYVRIRESSSAEPVNESETVGIRI
jgi:hypothetical protein